MSEEVVVKRRTRIRERDDRVRRDKFEAVGEKLADKIFKDMTKLMAFKLENMWFKVEEAVFNCWLLECTFFTGGSVQGYFIIEGVIASGGTPRGNPLFGLLHAAFLSSGLLRCARNDEGKRAKPADASVAMTRVKTTASNACCARC